MTEQFDVVVLGQGLAGTALAWSLRWAHARVLVIDREATVTASKVAAGLVTPITGQKLATTWRHGEFWPAALSFYRRVEAQTGSSLFRELVMVRLFADHDDASLFESRRSNPDFDRLVWLASPLLNDQWFETGLGGFEMTCAGQLDVLRYLGESRDDFREHGEYMAVDIDVPCDIELTGSGVRLPRLSISARTLVFCQGIDAMHNPWFSQVAFKPAKGELLTVRIPGLTEQRIVHRGIWLLPIGDELFKVGATYNWNDLTDHPTEQARDELLAGLRSFLRLPFDVVSQQAAVRPIHHNQFPVIGIHPRHPQLAFFNGLGSKGVLQAPSVGRQLANVLLNGGAIDAQIDLNRKTPWDHFISNDAVELSFTVMIDCHVKRAKGRPLTQQAQDLISQFLRHGDTAIDATAGNGHDTCFLAQCVGPSGKVFAIDLQEPAIDVTSKRLRAASLQNVSLLNDDHRRLNELIPREVHGRIGAIMFNLGFLPGGNRQVTTQPDSTRAAIIQAVDLLRPLGLLTVVAYTGHDGGAAEAQFVAALMEELPAERFERATLESHPGRAPGPRLFVVRRK
jgi:glycine/D-amino acid oxidase-like deaminating enzyme